MSIVLPRQFVLLDTEYTSWEGAQERDWSGPDEYREIIQIGAVRVGPGLSEEKSLLLYVRPLKNPVLSDFIKTLTGITQEDLDQRGQSLGRAVENFGQFAGMLPVYCYGKDGWIIEENCKLINIPFPFLPARFTDVQKLLAPALLERGVDPNLYSSGTLIEAFGKKGDSAHDALNDMRNLLAALAELKVLQN